MQHIGISFSNEVFSKSFDVSLVKNKTLAVQKKLALSLPARIRAPMPGDA